MGLDQILVSLIPSVLNTLGIGGSDKQSETSKSDMFGIIAIGVGVLGLIVSIIAIVSKK